MVDLPPKDSRPRSGLSKEKKKKKKSYVSCVIQKELFQNNLLT